MTFIFESHEGERREYFPAEWIEGGRYREIIDHLQWVERDIEGPKPNERPTLKSRWLRAKGRLNRPWGHPLCVCQSDYSSRCIWICVGR